MAIEFQYFYSYYFVLTACNKRELYSCMISIETLILVLHGAYGLQ